jgi:hypothetical protein
LRLSEGSLCACSAAMIQMRRSLIAIAVALVAVRVVYWLMNAELVHERIRGEFYHHHTDAHKHVTKQAKVWGVPRGGAANISLVDAEELAGRR